MNSILQVREIVKEFAKHIAVNHISFTVEQGQIYSLLGPNGAGKTSIVRMLMGLTKPDKGQIHFDLPATTEAQFLGYLPEERGIYQDTEILRTLVYLGRLRGLSTKKAKQASLKWLDYLELKDRAGEKIETLSKGNQQKVQFIAAILHEPSFLILDEPFSGFDPLNQEKMLEIIVDLKSRGMTVLLSAHQMALVERIADRILLINQGNKVLEGSLDDIRQQSGLENKITLTLFTTPGPELLQQFTSIEHYELYGNELILYLNRQTPVSELLQHLGQNFSIKSINSEQAGLHDIYIRTLSTQQPAQETEH